MPWLDPAKMQDAWGHTNQTAQTNSEPLYDPEKNSKVKRTIADSNSNLKDSGN